MAINLAELGYLLTLTGAQQGKDTIVRNGDFLRRKAREHHEQGTLPLHALTATTPDQTIADVFTSLHEALPINQQEPIAHFLNRMKSDFYRTVPSTELSHLARTALFQEPFVQEAVLEQVRQQKAGGASAVRSAEVLLQETGIPFSLSFVEFLTEHALADFSLTQDEQNLLFFMGQYVTAEEVAVISQKPTLGVKARMYHVAEKFPEKLGEQYAFLIPFPLTINDIHKGEQFNEYFSALERAYAEQRKRLAAKEITPETFKKAFFDAVKKKTGLDSNRLTNVRSDVRQYLRSQEVSKEDMLFFFPSLFYVDPLIVRKNNHYGLRTSEQTVLNLLTQNQELSPLQRNYTATVKRRVMEKDGISELDFWVKYPLAIPLPKTTTGKGNDHFMFDGINNLFQILQVGILDETQFLEAQRAISYFSEIRDGYKITLPQLIKHLILFGVLDQYSWMKRYTNDPLLTLYEEAQTKMDTMFSKNPGVPLADIATMLLDPQFEELHLDLPAVARWIVEYKKKK